MSLIDLSGVVPVVEQLFVDACRVLSDPEGVTDDDYDEVTDEFVEPDPDDPPDDVVAYSGPCMVAVGTQSRMNDIRDEEGRRRADLLGTAGLPLERSKRVKPGMTLVVTKVHDGGDKSLVGSRYTVGSLGTGTYAVMRVVDLVGDVAAERPDPFA